jgi:hypothetical protein
MRGTVALDHSRTDRTARRSAAMNPDINKKQDSYRKSLSNEINNLKLNMAEHAKRY